MTNPVSPRAIVLIVAALAVGCQMPETSLRVTVTFAASLSLDQLGFEVAPVTDESKQALVPATPAAPLTSGLRVALLVPDAWSGSETLVNVRGLGGGVELARGEGRVVPARREVTDLTVALAACRNACPLGDRRCVGDGTSLCEKSREGCSRWGIAEACGSATPACSNGSCAAICTDECAVGTARCSGDAGYQRCGQHDSDSCRDWGPVLACGEQELCQAGVCLPVCDGKPCSCEEGTITRCDVGECRGTRTCRDGQYGACGWTVPPAAERCDGKDNDCDGRIDNALPPEPCEKQQGVCKGAIKSCAGTAGWSSCGPTEYQTAAGGAYEALESKCDSKDNDCNGGVDEPSSCGTCQKQCGTRVCGPDPICGQPCGICTTGSCDTTLGRCLLGPQPQNVCPPTTAAATGTSLVSGQTSVQNIPLSYDPSHPTVKVACFSGNQSYKQAIALTLSVRTRLGLTLTTVAPQVSDSLELRDATCTYNAGGCSQSSWPFYLVKDPGTYTLVVSTVSPKAYLLEVAFLPP